VYCDYVTPAAEVLEFEICDAILTGSDEKGATTEGYAVVGSTW